MAIRQFGTVSFAGVDLSTFGVTLSGVGTYNAPERDVEYVEVPGRNGDIIIDHGRFKNIEVTYPVNIEDNFPDNIAALTAFLASQRGYQRLEDTRHPDEYRMACFAGPLEVNPTGRHNRYGTTELTFNCKPQRYIASGNTEALVVSGSRQFVRGLPTQIFNDATLARLGGGGSGITSDEYFAMDVTQYAATGGVDVMALYPEDYAQNITAWDKPLYGAVLGGIMTGSPLIGETAGTFNFTYERIHETQHWVQTTIPQTGEETWLVWPVPIELAIMVGSGVVISPDVPTLSAPNADFAYSPLIHFTVSGAVQSDMAVMLNNDRIAINTPATVGSSQEPVTDFYVDCESLNAYALIGGVTHNFNAYVQMIGEFIYKGDLKVQKDDVIDSVAIVPRWYKI